VFAAAAKCGADGVSLIGRALERAGRAHLGQFRRNGDPWAGGPSIRSANTVSMNATAVDDVGLRGGQICVGEERVVAPHEEQRPLSRRGNGRR
jgi:hypothetical protein